MPSKAALVLELPPSLHPMRAFYTAAIVEAAHRRVFYGESLPDGMSKAEKKAALILVRIINPEEILSEGEECILRGVTDKTLRGMKQRRELPVVCGGVNTVYSEE